MTRSFMLSCIALAAVAVQASAQTVVDPTRPAGPGQPYAAGQANPAGQVRPGQQAIQPRPGQRIAQPGQTGQTVDLNQAIAGCLLLGNQEEVALAEFAQSRAQNPRVKEFAQMMIQDHEQALAKLTRIAPELAQQAAALREAQTGARNAAAEPFGQTAAAGHQVFALQKRVAQECLALTQQELGQKQGPEFDECYMGSQVGAHIGMLAKLRGSQQFASGELKQVIQEAEQTVQKHLDQAKQIAKEVRVQGAPRQTSQRPSTTQPAVR